MSIIIGALLCQAVPLSAQAPKPPTEASCYACLSITDDGTVLWERNSSEPVAIASATKIVTALAVRDAAVDLAAEVEVSAGAAAIPGGKLSLEAGERFSVRELLFGLLMNSSNDAAVALAEHVAGSEAAFAGEMTALADELGADDSAFVTAHGLDEPGHHSSAQDLALLFAALLDDPLLAEIVGTATSEIDSQTRSVTLENTNLLLEGYPGMIGGKTGFTGDAGNVLVAAASRGGRTVISVALGSVDHFADTQALLDHGFEALRRTVLVGAETPAGLLFVDGGGATRLITKGNLRGPHDQDSLTTEFRSTIEAGPVGAGDPVGRLLVRSDDTLVGRAPVVAQDDLEMPDEPSWLADTLGGLLGAFSSFLPGEG